MQTNNIQQEAIHKLANKLFRIVTEQATSLKHTYTTDDLYIIVQALNRVAEIFASNLEAREAKQYSEKARNELLSTFTKKSLH